MHRGECCACRGRRGSTLRATLVRYVHVVVVSGVDIVIVVVVIIIVGMLFVTVGNGFGLETHRRGPDHVGRPEAKSIVTVRSTVRVLLRRLQTWS